MKFLDEIIGAVKTTKTIITGAVGAEDVIEKGDFNYVTAIDLKLQEMLFAKLKTIDGAAQFLGEEEEADIDWNLPAWVVDPVDGTSNLMHGYNHSAVSVAYWDGSAVKYAVIYDPYTDEMYSAKRGSGAYLNGDKIYVSDTKSVTHSLIAIETAPYNKELADETFDLYKKVFVRCRDLRLSGSAALDFAHVACGRVDAFFGRLLWQWDWAAGVLLVEEAGGKVKSWDNKALCIRNPQTDVLASNGHVNGTIFSEFME